MEDLHICKQISRLADNIKKEIARMDADESVTKLEIMTLEEDLHAHSMVCIAQSHNLTHIRLKRGINSPTEGE